MVASRSDFRELRDVVDDALLSGFLGTTLLFTYSGSRSRTVRLRLSSIPLDVEVEAGKMQGRRRALPVSKAVAAFPLLPPFPVAAPKLPRGREGTRDIPGALTARAVAVEKLPPEHSPPKKVAPRLDQRLADQWLESKCSFCQWYNRRRAEQ